MFQPRYIFLLYVDFYCPRLFVRFPVILPDNYKTVSKYPAILTEKVPEKDTVRTLGQRPFSLSEKEINIYQTNVLHSIATIIEEYLTTPAFIVLANFIIFLNLLFLLFENPKFTLWGLDIREWLNEIPHKVVPKFNQMERKLYTRLNN